MGALDASTTGSSNTAVGYGALTNSTTAGNNVAIGADCAAAITTGTGNVHIGTDAAKAMTTGSYSVAIGQFALDAATTQQGSVAIGYAALGQDSSSLGRNTAVGYSGLGTVSSGVANTCLGWASGGGVTTGSGNLCLGYITNTGHSGSENRIVIGYNFSGSSDNRVHIGSSSGYVYNDYTSNATWTQTSDERKKKDIVDDSLGLDFINDLRTTKYKFKAPSEFPKEWKSYNADITEPCDDKVHHGLIAQEVKQALDNAGVNSFEGWDELPDGTQQLSREMFVIPLIKAIQELSAEVETLKSQLGE